MADQVTAYQVLAEVEYDPPGRVTSSQVLAEVEWDPPGRVVASQVIAQVEYDGIAPSGTTGIDYQIPIVLLTLTTESGDIRRATSFYVDGLGRAYLPGLVFPDYKNEMKDLFSGVEQSGSLTIQIELGGGGLSTDVSFDTLVTTQELRSRWVSLYYYDPVAGEYTGDDIDFRGKIDSYELDKTHITLTLSTKDDEIFDKLLPPDVVTTDLFTDTALGLGAPVNMPIGHCRQVPCPNVCNDRVNDLYDYLVGYYGVTAVTTVYRSGYQHRRRATPGG